MAQAKQVYPLGDSQVAAVSEQPTMEDVDEKERINQEQIAQNQHFAMDLTRKLEGLSQATFEIGDVEY